MKSSVLKKRNFFKPFWYSWAHEAYVQQRRMHWIPEEVSLDKDVQDWNTKLSEEEKHLVTQIFRFFVQGDVDIAWAYLHKYIPTFKPPEIQMMLTAFANTEALHIHAYSLLLDTLGMPEVEYQAFSQYEEMAAKHEYFYKGHEDLPKDQGIAADLAIFSAFGEGMQLFSSFAILLNFTRFNKLEKMGRIIAWSIRDESLHVESMIKLFHAYLDEKPGLWNDTLKKRIYDICREMVRLEELFIDRAFELGGVEGLSKDDVKQYIYYIADRRLIQLGLAPNFKVKDNPLPWIEDLINVDEFANFFETEVIEYSSGMMTGDWTKAKLLNDEKSLLEFLAAN